MSATNYLAIGQPAIDPGNLLSLAAATTPPDPRDFTNRYNTQLTPAEEAKFQAWAQATGRKNDTYDYDLRGAFKSGAATSPNGHLPDTYKKPNHPTFSDQSQYHGVDGFQGGTWGGTDEAPTFTPSATNLQMVPAAMLQRYFQRVEPDAQLILPQAPP